MKNEQQEHNIKLTDRELRTLQICIYGYKYLYFPKTYRKEYDKEVGLLYSKIREHSIDFLKKNGITNNYKFFLDEQLYGRYKYEEEIETLKRTIEDEDDWNSLTKDEKIELITNYFYPLDYKIETIYKFITYGDKYHEQNI